MKIIKNKTAVLLAGLACMMLSVAANAATITVDSFGLKYGSSGAPYGKVQYSGAITSNVYAGEFTLTLDDGSKLDAFCIDVTNTIKSGVYKEESDAPAPGLDFVRIGKLFDYYYHLATDVNSTAAFQLALWAIVYEYNLSQSDAFGTAKATANIWLTNVSSLETPSLGSYSFTVLEPTNPTNNQRLLTAVRVPEPSGLALLGLGVLGAGAVRRVRKN